MRLRFKSLALAVGLAVGASSCLAQSNASVVRPHTIEIDPFIGGTYGGTGLGSQGETRVMGGANISYAVTKYILPYFEYSYFPGIPQSRPGTGSIPFTETYSIALQDSVSDIFSGAARRYVGALGYLSAEFDGVRERQTFLKEILFVAADSARGSAR